MPSTQETRALHAELLVLLKIFDELCRTNEIHYSLHGGTLLGAVREKGFIPWDDDADITLTRAEFEKFKALLAHVELPQYLEFDETSAQRPLLWMRRPGCPVVWLDLFIYDYISENRIARKLKLLGQMFFLGFTKTRATLEISQKGVYRGWKYAVICACYFLGRLFPMPLKIRWMNAFSKRAWTGRKQWIYRSNDQYKGILVVLPVSVMTQYERIPFEDDVQLEISKDYHQILVTAYGEHYNTPIQFKENEADAHELYRSSVSSAGK